MQAFQERPEQTLARLGVQPETGLSEQQAAQSRRENGENRFTREKPKSLVKRLVEAAAEPMILLLVLAGLITLGVNIARYATGGHTDFVECIGIFVAIALSVVITVVMEGRSAKAFEALNKISEDTRSKVIRDAEVQLLAQYAIAVGDVLCVQTGDRLPADGRVIESLGLTADESALTGESMPVQKDAQAVYADEKTPVAERLNMLYSGCFITGGSGKVVVTGVGDHTEFGKIARELSATDKGTTPLQEKMARLGKRITLLGASVAAVVFLVQLVRILAGGGATLDAIADAFITSIILIVAAVPEGLPTIVAVSLAINIIKMSKQNALVKKMVACETVGCINVICSDKTGTLTENRMTVTDICVAGVLCKPAALQDERLLENFCVNATADVRFTDARAEFIGNPTECALLTAAHKAGCDYAARRAAASIVHVYSFSSETKCMTTVLDAEGLTAYTKGSPEKILALCSLPYAQRTKAEAQIAHFQEKTSRVLGFAHKRVAADMDWETHRADVECEMVFDGFVAITDPLRADVYESVTRCRSAGISLKMLTGDNIITATAIANELGLLENGGRAVEARELEALTEEALADILPEIRVIARSTPVIKMRVVNALKARGNVVAVTGDGINDAPAIKNADVGVAMGITGTDVSKEASDIVLLDDSFSTIVKAVAWGRGIYENFQRFIQFQLTVNLSSVIVVLASILAGFAAPFSALQLLWINLIMDGPPALTLGLEPIRGDLMQRLPTRREASIVTKGMLWRILGNGVYIAAAMMAQSCTNFIGGTPTQLPTILFTLFVLFQLFNAFNSRELGNESVFKNFFGNRLMLLGLVATFGLQVLITQLGGSLFDTVPLPLDIWIKMLALALSVVVFSEFVKLVRRVLGK